MSLKKLGQQGITHVLTLALAVVVIGSVAAVGTKVLTQSHAAVPCTGQTFTSGSTGGCVTNIQEMLNGTYDVYSHLKPPMAGQIIAHDGQYGFLTAAQVTNFQRYWHGTYLNMTIDGTVRASTWVPLCQITASKGFSHNDFVTAVAYNAAIASGCVAH